MKKKSSHIIFSIPKKGLLIGAVLLAIALPITVIASLNQTNTQQHADFEQAPPPGCYYGSSCLGAHDTLCKPILVCPNLSPTCVPKPPQCKPGSPLGMPCTIPLGGWCPEVTPEVTAAVTVCVPIPPQCQPGSHLGIACPATPPNGWCLPVATSMPSQPIPPQPMSCSDCPSGFTFCRSNTTGQTHCINPELGMPQEGNMTCNRCPVTTVTPTPPAGCFYKPDYSRCPLHACSGASCNCPQILVCPTGIPQISSVPVAPSLSVTAVPTCLPRPSCFDQHPACSLPQPPGGWCQPTNQPISDSGITAVIVFLNTFFRNLLHTH